MPIYRYKCDNCGRLTEVMASLKEGAPRDHVCNQEIRYPKERVSLKPEAWLDAPTTNPVEDFEITTTQCAGMARRIYDDFQFHISGR
jgi:hypothetical protein